MSFKIKAQSHWRDVERHRVASQLPYFLVNFDISTVIITVIIAFLCSSDCVHTKNFVLYCILCYSRLLGGGGITPRSGVARNFRQGVRQSASSIPSYIGSIPARLSYQVGSIINKRHGMNRLHMISCTSLGTCLS